MDLGIRMSMAKKVITYFDNKEKIDDKKKIVITYFDKLAKKYIGRR